MTMNHSRNRIDDALINMIMEHERELTRMKTSLQPIGNGSLNYAVFSEFSAGPLTIPSGFAATVTIVFAPYDQPLYYDGKEAINRLSLSNLYWTAMVDSPDIAHAIPYGAALAGPERRALTSERLDYLSSGLSENNGQMYAMMQILNLDTSTHDYWIKGRMLIPRPALKPQ